MLRKLSASSLNHSHPGRMFPPAQRAYLNKTSRIDTMSTKSKLALAAAALFLTAPLTVFAAGEATGACAGVNACKGHSSCKSGDHGCKGQNSCKGQGVVNVDSATCDQLGGKFTK